MEFQRFKKIELVTYLFCLVDLIKMTYVEFSCTDLTESLRSSNSKIVFSIYWMNIC